MLHNISAIIYRMRRFISNDKAWWGKENSIVCGILIMFCIVGLIYCGIDYGKPYIKYQPSIISIDIQMK